MKILITGGLGYIGGRLALHLGQVYSSTNIRLLTRRKDESETPPWTKGYDVVFGDVLDNKSLLDACDGIDTVIHLAALNEIESKREPKRALKVNGEGTLNTLNAAVKENVTRFIYFSTFHVYGLNAKGEVTEDTIPAPVHPYAITHHVAEDFVWMVANNYELPSIILRLSNGFGYPSHPSIDRWSLVFNNFCLQAAVTNKIVLKSSGKQHRDFITLTDISRSVEHLLKMKISTKNELIYNLGGECSFSILDVAKMVAKQSKIVLEIEPQIVVGIDKQPIDQNSVIYRIDRIKRLGFKLTSNIEEEVNKTLMFCDKNKNILKNRLQQT